MEVREHLLGGSFVLLIRRIQELIQVIRPICKCLYSVSYLIDSKLTCLSTTGKSSKISSLLFFFVSDPFPFLKIKSNS